MADKDKDVVEVPLKALTEMQEKMAEFERRDEENRGKIAGLEELFSTKPEAEGASGIRKKNDYQPKFRTVRLRKYPIAGDFDNQGYIVGWTNRGAYQEVDRTGVSPQVVDYIDVIFLGQEKTKDGKIKAEKIKLLDMLNKGVQVHCKIVKMEKDVREIPTGEELSVNVWNDKHGLVSTGETIDGYIIQSEIMYTIQIPGVEGTIDIDGVFVN